MFSFFFCNFSYNKNNIKEKYLVIIALFLFVNSSCETEKLDSTTNEFTEIQNSFSDDFSTLLPFENVIDWSTAKKGFSEEFDSEIFEFNVLWTGNYSPEDLYVARNRNDAFKNANYKISYKVIAVKEADNYNFYVLKFSTSDDNSLADLSIFTLNSLSGYFTIYNKESEKVASKIYKEGKFLLSLMGEESSLTKRCNSIHLVTIYNYYNLRETGPDFNFSRTEIQTIEICDNYTIALDESNNGGSVDSGGGNPYSFNVVEDVILEEEEPSCKSFVFKEVTTNSKWQAATVKDFEMGVGVYIMSNFQSYRIEFSLLTFETWSEDRFGNTLSPGAAAELAAQAVEDAAWATTHNFQEKYDFTEYEVKKWFEDFLKKQFRSLTDGGTVTRGNPYNLTPNKFEIGRKNGCND